MALFPRRNEFVYQKMALFAGGIGIIPENQQCLKPATTPHPDNIDDMQASTSIRLAIVKKVVDIHSGKTTIKRVRNYFRKSFPPTCNLLNKTLIYLIKQASSWSRIDAKDSSN